MTFCKLVLRISKNTVSELSDIKLNYHRRTELLLLSLLLYRNHYPEAACKEFQDV